MENGSSIDPAFNPTLCAQISGNPATGSGPDGFGNTFAGIDLIERSGNSNTTYRLQIHGLTPNPATAAQTETYLAGQNPASSLGGGFYAGKRASVSEGNHVRGLHDHLLGIGGVAGTGAISSGADPARTWARGRNQGDASDGRRDTIRTPAE